MNIPWPIKQEMEHIWNEVTGMVQSGSETINNLMENLWTTLPYVVVTGIVLALVTKYGIEFGEKLFRKA
jgi:hypothetical protein